MINIDKDKIKRICKNVYSERPELSKQPSENNAVYILNFDSFKKVIKIAEQGKEWINKKEVSVIRRCSLNDIPVPKIDYEGSFPEIMENRFFIMDFLGEHNLNQINSEEEKDLLRKSGRILAKIHQVEFDEPGLILQDKVKKETTREYLEKKFKKYVNILELGELRQYQIQKAKKIFANLKVNEGNKLCHNNFGPWQVITNKAKISGIIDWELARSCPPAYDIAKSEFLTDVISQGFEEIKKGYSQVRGIPDRYSSIKKPYQVVVGLELLNFFRENKQSNERLYTKTKEKLEELL